ncbi:uncharacterized protein LOC115258737 [Aedes albopictus]|uniref:Secreted protein n=1 Tax=Aedes albopictus TaxID=7160 RepID=A0ABM2A3Y3_AEDAL|nr:uncharacterized protein LOC115258737 [Aedes albopictus]
MSSMHCYQYHQTSPSLPFVSVLLHNVISSSKTQSFRYAEHLRPHNYAHGLLMEEHEEDQLAIVLNGIPGVRRVKDLQVRDIGAIGVTQMNVRLLLDPEANEAEVKEAANAMAAKEYICTCFVQIERYKKKAKKKRTE